MSAMVHSPLIIGTRGSALALWQANHVRSRLEAAGCTVQLELIRTTGDRILDVPLSAIGDKGLFTKELDAALLDGRIHVAVHSLKDLPTQLPEGIVLAAVSEREEPWDAFVAHPGFGGKLADLPPGARLGTSSLRRQAQLRAWRGDLELEPIRGNVDTRLARLDAGDLHGIVLARAGLVRLGLASRIRETIGPDIMLPAVGQGALGIVCAGSDEATRALLQRVLHHSPTAAAVYAERALLRRLEGGCSVPVGAYGRVEGGRLVLDGSVAALDGSVQYRDRVEGAPDEADRLGNELAERLLNAGADAILAGIRKG